MSREAARAFVAQLERDESLCRRVLALRPEGGTGVMDRDLEALGAAHGLHFAADEVSDALLERSLYADGELDDLQLQAVAGGAAAQNPIFTSVSNVLKTRHDTVKNSIGA
jgi:hypothetical protein